MAVIKKKITQIGRPICSANQKEGKRRKLSSSFPPPSCQNCLPWTASHDDGETACSNNQWRV